MRTAIIDVDIRSTFDEGSQKCGLEPLTADQEQRGRVV